VSFAEIAQELGMSESEVVHIYAIAIGKLRDSDLRQFVREADIRLPRLEHDTPQCLAPGCIRAVRAVGMCDTHYRQMRKGNLAPIGNYRRRGFGAKAS
jgi:hypothetical protein